MGKKWPKNGFWPHREKEEKMAEKWENWPKNGSKLVIFPFFGHFSPFFPVGPKSIFRPFFSHFGSGLYRAIGIATLVKGRQPTPKTTHPNKNSLPTRECSRGCFSSFFPRDKHSREHSRGTPNFWISNFAKFVNKGPCASARITCHVSRQNDKVVNRTDRWGCR